MAWQRKLARVVMGVDRYGRILRVFACLVSHLVAAPSAAELPTPNLPGCRTVRKMGGVCQAISHALRVTVSEQAVGIRLWYYILLYAMPRRRGRFGRARRLSRGPNTALGRGSLSESLHLARCDRVPCRWCRLTEVKDPLRVTPQEGRKGRATSAHASSRRTF